MRAYTNNDGVARIEVWKDGILCGTFGLVADVGAPFAPNSWVELDDERIAAVGVGLQLFGEGPHEYRQSPHPHMHDPAVNDPQPHQPPRRKAAVEQSSDPSPVPPGDQGTTGGG